MIQEQKTTAKQYITKTFTKYNKHVLHSQEKKLTKKLK